MTRMLRLLDGDLIISDVEEKGDTLELTTPMILNIIPQEGNQIGIGLIPFHAFARSLKHIITISKNHVLCDLTDDIPATVLDQYNQMTSGLVIPRMKV